MMGVVIRTLLVHEYMIVLRAVKVRKDKRRLTGVESSRA